MAEPQGNYYPPPLVRPTSGMAITGFILSIVGLSLPGLIVSALAVKRTGTGELGGHGFSIAGIVIGIIGTIVWIVLVGGWLVLLLGLAAAPVS